MAYILKVRDENGNFTGIPAITGEDGVGIKSIKQTTTSTEDGGTNVITVTLTDGTTSTFSVKNGTKGNTGGTGATGATGADGYTPQKGIDYFTEADKSEIVSEVTEKLPQYATEGYVTTAIENAVGLALEGSY